MAGYDDGMFGNLPRPKLKGRVAATPDPGQPLTPAVQAVRPQQSAQPGPEPSYADQLAQWLYAKGTANLPASFEPGLRNTLEGAANLYNQWTPTGSFEGGVRQGMQGNAAGFVTGVLGAAPIPGAPGGRIAAKGAEEAVEGAAEAAAKSGITAYHGSPYDFDRFDISKIGTGEGNQSYGHGLYFAGNERTAENYRDVLGGDAIKIGDQTIVPKPGTPEDMALAHLTSAHIQQFENPYAKARLSLREQAQTALPQNADTISQARNVLDQWQDAGGVPGSSGHMYQVNINADPEQFLDWDKPFEQQSPTVQKAINDLWTARGGSLEGRDNPPFVASASGNRGESIHAAIATTYGGAGKDADAQAAASQALADAGVPGIKYLDQGSRGGGEGGTQNYVTFSDKNIDILRKYGLAGLGLTAGAGALSASGQSPVSSPAEAAPPPQGITLGAQPNWSP